MAKKYELMALNKKACNFPLFGPPTTKGWRPPATPLYTLYSIHYTVYTIQCTLNTVYIAYNVCNVWAHWKLDTRYLLSASVHCTVYSVHLVLLS